MDKETFLNEHQETIRVTVWYFVMYYCFVFSQSLTKFYLFHKAKAESKEEVKFVKIKYQSQDRLALTADRTVGNCLEQMMPFLVSLWLHSLVVSAESASFYGWIYIYCRMIYPMAFKLGIPWLFLSTLPNYACIFLLFSGTVQKIKN